MESNVFISAEEAAKIMGCHAQDIRNQAQTDAAKLGFPVNVMGSRVRIPRKPFMEFWGLEDV